MHLISIVIKWFSGCEITFNEWVIGCCLLPIDQFFSYIMARTNYIQLDDNDVGFVLDQHA
jgi:hypothetical protein